jgi:O-antigen biosynthesis protein WbqV
MVELNPGEGVLTNAIGTCNIADAAFRSNVLAMVQVSTDKVVNPTSVMGATKRLAELYCQALDLKGCDSSQAPRFMTVRFGNVLGSSGSLVPLFERQLKKGGPLTVTHPEIKRYFMTVREAVELILQASAHGLATKEDIGQIFVLDMGDPIKIIDIARRIIRLAGKEPDRDVKIEIIGLRPGEKLFEELFDASETRLAASMPGILRAAPRPVPLERLQDVCSSLAAAAAEGDVHRLRELLADVLVGYEPWDAVPDANGEPVSLERARERRATGPGAIRAAQ